MPFIGVVSNRTTDFDTNPMSGGSLLIDSFGIGAHEHSVYDPTQRSFNDSFGNLFIDRNYSGMRDGAWITVKYCIHDSKLIFENLKDDKSFSMKLPTDIDGITEWYPVMGLRYVGTVCEIQDIQVK